MTSLVLSAPIAGWSLALSEVPDPVFAQKMAGDGVAIDPTGSVLHAPCDGEIVPMKDAKHALTLRAAGGIEILMHLGIDTVRMKGEGFEPLARASDRVVAGQPLLRFDMDLVARRAKSLVTPILLASEGVVVRRCEERAVAVGDFLMEIGGAVAAARDTAQPLHEVRKPFRVPFEHGLHARPAALIAAALRPIAAEVTIVSRGRSANARSTVSLMSLGIECGDMIEVRAQGAEADFALAALERLLAPATVADAAPPQSRSSSKPVPKSLEAVVACRGLVLGTAVQWAQPEPTIEESGGDAKQEALALREALGTVRTHLEALARAASREQREVLAAHVELIQDPELARAAQLDVARGKSAGYAWRAASRASIEALRALGDERMLERAADLRDLENQVLRVLAGEPPGAARELPQGAIVLADELLPSQLFSLDRARLAGLCMARGGPTSHVAILAAAMGLPALVAAGEDLLRIAEGTLLVLDAERGRIEVAPSPQERAAFEQALAARAAQQAADLARAGEPGTTADQVPIAVLANLGALHEVAHAIAQGAEGCGLLRTEFLYLDRREPPGEDEQAREYQAIAEALRGRTLTIRTLDVGGDKPIAYLPLPREDNPALGLRGLRTSLWKPELLRTQLQAILRVKPLENVRILLPMVTDVEDVRAVRAMLGESRVALGAMIETPASALLADQIIGEVDFLSIGTNDLSQYALAMDRGHPELASRLDALHPAVLRLIAAAAGAAHGAGKEVAVCGGLASDPAAIAILIGLGIREFSAVPAMIPRIKGAIRALDVTQCEALARRALEQSTAHAVRELSRQATGG